MQDRLAAAVYKNMVAVNGGPRDDADPDEVVDDGRWAGAVGAARLNVPNKLTGGQLDGIGLAERVALQEFQMGLLAALPARDRLECIDVPADQLGDGGRAVLYANQGCRVFKRDFAVFCPSLGRGAMIERFALLVQHRCSATKTDHSRIACDTIRLPACFDHGPDESLRGQEVRKAFLSPLCPLGNL